MRRILGTGIRRYILIMLMGFSALAIGNEKIQTAIKYLIEIVQNLPEDIFSSSTEP